MRNKITLRALLALMTLAAIVAALSRYDGQVVWVTAAMMVIEMVGFTLAFYALLFIVAYPLGRLNKYFQEQVDQGQSPFATDRLPQQIIPPAQHVDS